MDNKDRNKTMNPPEEAKSAPVIENLDDDIGSKLVDVSSNSSSKPERATSSATATSTTSSIDSKDGDDSSGDGKQPAKKRTWKKPKDKPKRPLSAYNIFFQHQRSRIVEGFTEPASPDEIVRSIEGILTKKGEKRRHRKTHGRISFGDLARAIAEAWKSIDPKSKSIFDHYAEVDMMRYKRELKAWKDKKEMEEEANAIQKHADFMNRMNASSISVGSANASASEIFANLPDESVGSSRGGAGGGNNSSHSDPSNRRRASTGGIVMSDSTHRASTGGIEINEDFNNSFTSVDSNASDFSYEPSTDRPTSATALSAEQQQQPMRQILNRQQQLLQQQLRESSHIFMGSNIPNQGPNVVPSNNEMMMMHSSFGSLVQGGNNMFPQMMNNMNQQQMGSMGGMQQQQQMGMQQQQQQMMTAGMQFQSPLQSPIRSVMTLGGSSGGGGFGNWNSAAGNSSLQSLQPNESLFTPSNHGPPNHVSDYSGGSNSMTNMMSHHTQNQFSSSLPTSGFCNSFSSGFDISDGLAPPTTSASSNFNQQRMGLHNSFSDMRYAGRQQQQQQQKRGNNDDRRGLHDSFAGGGGGMDIDNSNNSNRSFFH